MKALIFDIKRFAIHDGPGIRTTIFFKGCPLDCPWCHNPESRSNTMEYYNHSDKVGSKSFISEKTIGNYYSISELLDEILKDEIFYEKSNGGVTCSGGEPIVQSSFMESFLSKCTEKGIHTALDTSGYAEQKVFMKVAPYVNLFLFDIKHLDKDIHKYYTGVTNTLILENFDWIVNSGYNVIARIPIIPDINDDPEYIKELQDFMNERKRANFNEVHILPYHRIGCGKYDTFNIESHHSFNEPSSEMVEEIADIFRESGFITKIGG